MPMNEAVRKSLISQKVSFARVHFGINRLAFNEKDVFWYKYRRQVVACW